MVAVTSACTATSGGAASGGSGSSRRGAVDVGGAVGVGSTVDAGSTVGAGGAVDAGGAVGAGGAVAVPLGELAHELAAAVTAAGQTLGAGREAAQQQDVQTAEGIRGFSYWVTRGRLLG